ncbi:MAG: hypothetical protein HOQ21_13520 [Dermatophilaceae bacterium]|nr:hypothetical protein [Dermatophilaceae bacterium]
MAKYLVLIYGSEQEWDAQTPEELSAKEAGHIAFSRAAGAGRLSGEELESATSATTLRASRDGAPVVTDGPFMETKEALGGFYIVDVLGSTTRATRDLDLAEECTQDAFERSCRRPPV